MTYKKIIIAIVPIFLFFLFVTAPMLMMPRDMWDGTIIEYASMINDYSGLEAYFFESTWFLQYPLSLFVIESAQYLNISYKNANALLVFGIALFLLREVFCISKNRLKFSSPASYYAVTLVATFSTWGVLFSSIMTLHFGCIALGLFSIRMIHKKTTASKLFGYLALIASFSLQSQLVFLPVLSYIYDLNKKNTRKYLNLVIPSKETILILSAGLTFFLVVKLFFPPHGLYENYHSLVGISPEGLLRMLGASIKLGTYLVPTLAIIGLLYLIMLSDKQAVINHMNNKMKSDPFFVRWLLVLFIAGIFPYAAVGAFSHFLDITDWSNRQGMLLAVPASLFAALCFQIMYDGSSSKLIKMLVIGGSSVLLVFQISLMSVNLIHKLNRQIFVTELESLVEINEERLSPGVLQIIGSGIPGPGLRTYESNFLMYSATGRADWWTHIRREENTTFTIPCNIQLNRAYQIKYAYNYDPSHYANHTIVEVDVSGFRGLGNALRNVLGINDPGLVELANVYLKPKQENHGNEVCN
jgi:hypothetical protein